MAHPNNKTLGEICDEVGGIIRTGPFGSQLHQSDYQEEGLPVVMPKDIVNGKIALDSIARIGKDDENRLQDHKLRKGDIVFARRGDVGRCALIKEREDGWLCGTGSLRVSLGDKVIDPTFLFYYLNLSNIIGWIQKRAIGATLPNLNTSIIRDIPISYPPLPTQRHIADILSAYDDLIENHTRRIRILEQMAQAIYQEWFGKVDKESLPKGWNISKFIDVCNELIDGDWIETKDQGGEDYRLLQVSNVGLGDFVETGNFRYITQETFERLNCNEVVLGDILISRMPKPIGRGWLVTKMSWRMITAVDVAIARPNPKLLNPFYCIYWLNSSETLAKSEQHASGTTRPRITRRDLAGFEMVIPPIEFQNKFGKIAGELYTLQTNLRRKNANLRQTRDLLLPRLVGGEVEVSEDKRRRN
ncbi:MAG: restriction endonuclease subunit S [Chloroflexota bacterium]